VDLAGRFLAYCRAALMQAATHPPWSMEVANTSPSCIARAFVGPAATRLTGSAVGHSAVSVPSIRPTLPTAQGRDSELGNHLGHWSGAAAVEHSAYPRHFTGPVGGMIFGQRLSGGVHVTIVLGC